MKSALYWLSALVAAVVQASYLAGWRPWGIVPGLALVVVVQTAVEGAASRALIAAVAAGLVLDLAAGDRFGFNTTFFVMTVLAVAWLKRGGTVFGPALQLLAVAGATLLQSLLMTALMLGHAGLPVGQLLGRLAVTLVANLVLAGLLYLPLGAVLHGGAEENYGKA